MKKRLRIFWSAGIVAAAQGCAVTGTANTTPDAGSDTGSSRGAEAGSDAGVEAGPVGTVAGQDDRPVVDGVPMTLVGGELQYFSVGRAGRWGRQRDQRRLERAILRAQGRRPLAARRRACNFIEATPIPRLSRLRELRIGGGGVP